MLMNRALIVSKVLMWQALHLLQLNYNHNYGLVACVLRQTQPINGNNIYPS